LFEGYPGVTVVLALKSSYRYFSKKVPRYKPVLLKLNDVEGLTPFRIFFLLLALTAPVSLWFDSPVASPLQFAYAVAIGNFLVEKYGQFLKELKPVLTLTDTQFRIEKFTLSHFHLWHILAGTLIAPVVFLFVNWQSTDLQAFLAGEKVSGAFLWSFGIALVSWIFILQAYNVVVSGVFKFRRLGRYHTKINLLDTDTLNPYSMVGISTLLIIIGSYVIVPVAYFDSSDLLQPALLSLFVSLPTAIFFLLVPIMALHGKIKKAKKEEFNLITEALKGKKDKIRELHIYSDGESFSNTDLLFYRKYVEEIDEWPLDNSGLVRLIIYAAIPVFTWVASWFVEQVLGMLL